MKQKKIKKGIEIIVICLLLMSFLGNCNCAKKKTQILKYLGTNIPTRAEDLNVFRINFDSQYRRPYNVYITFKIDSSGLLELVKNLDLVSQKSNYTELMCLQKLDSGFVNSLWSFKNKNRFEIDKEPSNKLSWWNPNINKNTLLYASFYSETKKIKIESCYTNKWDGRLLLGYDKNSETVNILIEVLM